ncbi:hypothetical protein [Subtercola boreus]|nr:hypothetical protein [Subtercola boreus]
MRLTPTAQPTLMAMPTLMARRASTAPRTPGGGPSPQFVEAAPF